MKVDPHEAVAALAPAALLALALGGAAALLWATLEPAERAVLGALVEPRLALVAMLWLVLALAGGVALRAAWLRFGAAPGQLAEDLQVLLNADGRQELSRKCGSATFLDPRGGRLASASLGALHTRGGAGSQALAAAVNALVQQRTALRNDIAAQVRAASHSVEQERSRLAALMAELTQSVVVCNLDGRVLLYNDRARAQFRALPQAAELGGAELLGLGRSIHAVLSRALVAHALQTVQTRLQRGESHPAAQFAAATPGGQLLRVQMAPVLDAAAQGSEPPLRVVSGYVLMLDNVTRGFTAESARDRMLHSYTERSRASLGNLQAAVELLDDPALDTATRERLQAVVRDEAAAMGASIHALAQHTAQTAQPRWPLEDMLGADLVAAALQRIAAAHGCRASAAEVDATLWLAVDSYALLRALVALAGRLVGEYGVRHLQLRLQAAGPRAQLDLVWFGQAMSTETVVGWETEPLQSTDGDNAPAMTLRDVVERHGGAFWFERERVRQAAFFRFLLPLAADAVLAASEPHPGGEGRPEHPRGEGRPEFYDFDLFKTTEPTRQLAEQPLAELAYTVFDTETTGLDPKGGDEIVQIGATRIVAGKLRRQECFEQLVDPQRGIPAASTAVHGITPAQVAGQPTLAAVLPAFHAFAADTVLVGHNVAFDLRFLQLKEAQTGVRFEQPVLDTLLLSAVLHPQQPSHRLEALAQRYGVPVLARHTALGDATVTAEIFLKMIPLLKAQGLHTLGQVLDASQKTAFARVTY